MPRNITLDHVRIIGFEVQRRGLTNHYTVKVRYRLEGVNDEFYFARAITRHSSGHPDSPKLPGGWETRFNDLFADMLTAITALENL